MIVRGVVQWLCVVMCVITLLHFKNTNCLLAADEVREGLDVHFAETYDDVYTIAFEYDDDAAAVKVEPHSEQRLAETAPAA